MGILTTKDVAEILGKSTHYVQWLFRYGLLKSREDGRGYRTTAEEVQRYILWSEGKKLRNRADIIREGKKL